MTVNCIVLPSVTKEHAVFASKILPAPLDCEYSYLSLLHVFVQLYPYHISNTTKNCKHYEVTVFTGYMFTLSSKQKNKLQSNLQ